MNGPNSKGKQIPHPATLGCEKYAPVLSKKRSNKFNAIDIKKLPNKILLIRLPTDNVNKNNPRNSSWKITNISSMLPMSTFIFYYLN